MRQEKRKRLKAMKRILLPLLFSGLCFAESNPTYNFYFNHGSSNDSEISQNKIVNQGKNEPTVEKTKEKQEQKDKELTQTKSEKEAEPIHQAKNDRRISVEITSASLQEINQPIFNNLSRSSILFGVPLSESLDVIASLDYYYSSFEDIGIDSGIASENISGYSLGLQWNKNLSESWDFLLRGNLGTINGDASIYENDVFGATQDMEVSGYHLDVIPTFRYGGTHFFFQAGIGLSYNHLAVENLETFQLDESNDVVAVTTFSFGMRF